MEQAGVQLVAQDATEFQRALAASSAAVDKFGRGLDDAGKDASSFGDIATGALRRVGELAVNALGAAASALGSFIASSVSGAADYEQSMNVLQAQSGATDAEMQKVKETAKALGADLTLPATSAADAGAAMLELSKAGLSVDESMSAAKGTLQLAAAAQIDEARAAEITAGALNTFGLAGSEATDVADMLAAAANASSANMTDLADGVKQAGFIFADTKQPIDTLVTSLAILTNNGLTGSDAGTALKNAMMRLIKPTKEAAGVMRQYGIDVHDSNGQMLPFRDIVGMLDTKLKGLNDKQRQAALSTIFLSDGYKALAPLLRGGTAAFDEMNAKVNAQGTAAKLAGAQMKGLNGAVAGLGSQVETLALEALEPLLPIMTGVITKAAELAGSFVGHVGPAVQGLIQFFSEVGGIINTTALPAITGLTAALIAYGVTAIAPILVNLPAMTAVLIYNTTAFIANAAAVAAAVAPYALIAAAIGGVVYAWQNFNEKVTSATDQLLASKPFWQESTRALEEFGNASTETRAKLQPLADSIETQRQLLHDNIEDLGRRMAAGLVTEEQYRSEMEALNAQATAIKSASASLAELTQAEVKAEAATMTATQQTETQTDALSDNQDQIQLTEQELKELAKQLDKTFKDGTQAVQDYVTTAAGLMKQLQDTNKKTGDRITVDQAAAYAEQAAAQRAHLGEMLAEYTLAQTQLGNITNEQADVILQAIEKQFGTADDSSARTFLHMEQTIDQFAQNGGTSVDELAGNLGDLQDDAIETKAKMDALATKYTAELVQNFKDGKIDADEFRKALEQIPRKVTTEVHTEYTSSGGGGGGGGGAKAEGGPVKKDTTYLVGEKGPELFRPAGDGVIIPNHRIAPPANAQQIMAAGNRTTTTTINQQKTYNYSPVYSQAPRAPATDFAIMQALAI